MPWPPFPSPGAAPKSCKEELHRLKTVERHAVIQAIAEARAQGDLSENAEYEAAKDKQGFIEGRILEVESKLAAAQVIDPAALDADGRVVFGSTVELEDEDSGAAVTYQIVGDDEADLKPGLISISSPIARALIGKEEGDIAEVQAPGGMQELRDRRRPLRLRRAAARKRRGTGAPPRAASPPRSGSSLTAASTAVGVSAAAGTRVLFASLCKRSGWPAKSINAGAKPSMSSAITMWAHSLTRPIPSAPIGVETTARP